MTAPATPAAPAVPGAAGTTDEPAGAGPAAAADGASPRRRPAGPWAIWALDIVLAALAAAVYFGAVHGTGVFPHLHVRLRWYELAAAFGLTEVYVIHLQFRAEAHSVSVNELPLVVGLVFASPHDLILGQLAGAAAALILHRRQAPVKLCFNLANLSLQTVLAALVFHTVVAGHDPVSPIGWIAALLAAVTCAGVAIASIVIAIVLSEGHIPSRRAAQTFALGLAATFTTSNLGVVAVLLLASTPLAVAPLLVLTVVLVTAYR
ncbi:MAG TPA: hypothetical protein VFH45_08005, partial [Acidimicrobiales bacterium]|nr:hypothetical protein [Acidimicrobiales bacterium]